MDADPAGDDAGPDELAREPGEGIAQQIARSASRLFASRGYDATSVREIVEAAGVTKPTLYYHFGSKEGLAQALLSVPMERSTARLRELLGRRGEPIETLAAMIDVHFSFFRDDPDRARFVYALFFGPMDSGLAAEMSRIAEHFDELMAEGVGRLVEAGLVAPARAGAFLVAIRGLIVVHSLDFLYRGRDLDPALARGLVDDLLRGYGAAGEGRS